MKIKLSTIMLGLGLTLYIFMVFAPSIRATLGEQADSVTVDQKILSADKPSTQSCKGYRVQEVKSDVVNIREYISPGGIVFAIAWNGMVHPDLMSLLGSFAGDYEAAQRRVQPEPGRRHLQVRANQVVVEKWGHMRDLRGRAYVPALIPIGVTIDEVD
jgi:hypothetical protein